MHLKYLISMQLIKGSDSTDDCMCKYRITTLHNSMKIRFLFITKYESILTQIVILTIE